MINSPFSLTDLAKIIERDSKDSTYKFALLRGTIDIIQNFPHYRETDGQQIFYPMGLMILKWIEYYLPLAGQFIRELNISLLGHRLAEPDNWKTLGYN